MRALVCEIVRGGEQRIAAAVILALDRAQPIHLVVGEVVATLPLREPGFEGGGSFVGPVVVLEDEDRGQRSDEQRRDLEFVPAADCSRTSVLPDFGAPLSRTFHRMDCDVRQACAVRARQPWIAM